MKITVVQDIEFPVHFDLDTQGVVSISGTLINTSDHKKYPKLVVIGVFNDFFFTNNPIGSQLGILGSLADDTLRNARGGYQIALVGRTQNLQAGVQRPIQWQYTLDASEFAQIPAEVRELPKGAEPNNYHPYVLWGESCRCQFLIMEEASWNLLMQQSNLPTNTVLVPGSIVEKGDILQKLADSMRSPANSQN